MLCIWLNCSLKSSKSNPLPLLIFLASFSVFCLSSFFSASSMRDNISPIPSILEAMRSGWKASKASAFSPTPKNFMGFPVMCLTDRAAPPLASPSAFVSTTPVRGNTSSNALAVAAASWPVIASTTNKVSMGFNSE